MSTLDIQHDFALLPHEGPLAIYEEQRRSFNNAYRRLLNTRVRPELERFLEELSTGGFWVEACLDNSQFPAYLHESYLIYERGKWEPVVLSVVGQFDNKKVYFYRESPRADTHRLGIRPEDFREEDLCNWLHEVFSI